jgi:DHA2 family multidrug resistance protein
MANIAQDRMGYATSLFNLMRNIGGSIGIAMTSTILQRQRQAIGASLGEHISIYDPVTQTMYAQIQNGLIAAGVDAVTAGQRAYAILRGMLLAQASMVSYVYLFRLLGIVFLLMLPLVMIMKRAKRGGAAVGVH